MKENLLCWGLSCCITLFVGGALWETGSRNFGPSQGGIRAPRSTPQDFTIQNEEMNSPTDYVSNTLCSSSLSDAQVEHSLKAQT